MEAARANNATIFEIGVVSGNSKIIDYIFIAPIIKYYYVIYTTFYY